MIAGRSEVIANARCGFGLIREGSAQLSWRQLRFTSPCSWRPRCVERRATNGRTRERKQQYLRGSCSPCFWVSPAPAFTSGAPRLGGSTQRATRRTTCLPISPFQKMGRPLLVVLSEWTLPTVCGAALLSCSFARSRWMGRASRLPTKLHDIESLLIISTIQLEQSRSVNSVYLRQGVSVGC